MNMFGRALATFKAQASPGSCPQRNSQPSQGGEGGKIGETEAQDTITSNSSE